MPPHSISVSCQLALFDLRRQGYKILFPIPTLIHFRTLNKSRRKPDSVSYLIFVAAPQNLQFPELARTADLVAEFGAAVSLAAAPLAREQALRRVWGGSEIQRCGNLRSCSESEFNTSCANNEINGI